MTKDNSETQTDNIVEGDLSKLLQHYRESAGYSVKQTADALCLPETTIIKLESEEFETLAEPPYVRGYLRSYAKLTDQNPDELVRIYETLRGASPDELEHHFKPNSSAKRKSSAATLMIRLLLFLIVVAGLIALSMIPMVQTWFNHTWKGFTEQTRTKINANSVDNPLLTGDMPTPMQLPAADNSSKPDLKTILETVNPSVSPSTLPTSPENPKKSLVNASLKGTASDKTGNNLTPNGTVKTISDSKKTDVSKKSLLSDSDIKQLVDNANNKVKIKLVFNKEVWLRIRDKNKKTVYEGQNPAGDEKVLKLEKPLTFRIGNAQGLSIFENGKPIDITTYIKGSIANFTIK